jgi:hypothetical protein
MQKTLTRDLCPGALVRPSRVRAVISPSNVDIQVAKGKVWAL